jgi:hypothetical protein
MKLTLKERISLTTITSTGTRYVERILLQSIIQKTAITSKEIEQYEIIDTNNGVFWNKDKAQEVDFEFTKEELEVLIKSANAADKNELITDSNFSLVDKLMKVSIPS